MKVAVVSSVLFFIATLELSAQTGAPPDAAHFCSLIQVAPGASADDATLLRAYNGQARRVRSLHLEAAMRGIAGKRYGIGDAPRDVPVSIDIHRPAQLRVTGSLPFMSSRGFDLASDGRDFHLMVPDHGKRIVIAGPADAQAQSQNPRENLRPEPLIDALLWQEGTARGAGRNVAGAQTREFELDMPPIHGARRSAKVIFDLRHGEVDSIATYDATGRVIEKATYSDWRPVDGSSGPSGSACLPRRIEVDEPEQDYQINLRVFRLDINPEIPQNRFHLAVPQGASVVQLDATGKTKSR